MKKHMIKVTHEKEPGLSCEVCHEQGGLIRITMGRLTGNVWHLRQTTLCQMCKIDLTTKLTRPTSK